MIWGASYDEGKLLRSFENKDYGIACATWLFGRTAHCKRQAQVVEQDTRTLRSAGRKGPAQTWHLWTQRKSLNCLRHDHPEDCAGDDEQRSNLSICVAESGECAPCHPEEPIFSQYRPHATEGGAGYQFAAHRNVRGDKATVQYRHNLRFRASRWPPGQPNVVDC